MPSPSSPSGLVLFLLPRFCQELYMGIVGKKLSALEKSSHCNDDALSSNSGLAQNIKVAGVPNLQSCSENILQQVEVTSSQQKVQPTVQPVQESQKPSVLQF